MHVLVLDDISQLVLVEENAITNCKLHTNKISRMTLVTKYLSLFSWFIFCLFVFGCFWLSSCSIYRCFIWMIFNISPECRKQVKKHYRNRPGIVSHTHTHIK